MSFFDKFFKKQKSADVAKDRLMMMLAYERASVKMNNLDVDNLKKDLIEVIKKYIDIDDVKLKTDHNQNFETFEIEVLLKK